MANPFIWTIEAVYGGYMWSAWLGARGATAQAKRARGYMWSARLGASVGRATDGRPTDLEKEGLAIGESVCVCVCLCEGAALLREFLSRAREKG